MSRGDQNVCMKLEIVSTTVDMEGATIARSEYIYRGSLKRLVLGCMKFVSALAELLNLGPA